MSYKNQSILLASKHEKEQAIATPFAQRLSCQLVVLDFDTDVFGTFTDEIERTQSPYDTCVLKAKSAAAEYNMPLALASEGSFGPHPAMPFIPCDHEIMVFVDEENGFIIHEQLISQKTNYASLIIDRHTDLQSFLTQALFPSHALTLQSATSKRVIGKGIRDHERLGCLLDEGFAQEDRLLLATDMRAMMNPSRMAVIGELADKLAQRIACLCPGCGAPGFGYKTTRGHLHCTDCDAPTALYEHEVMGCIQCDHENVLARHDGMTDAEPRYCDYCNP